jgi:hypothetical protein
MSFILALLIPFLSFSKPLIRHINTSVDDYYEFLSKNPGSEEFVPWQKEQILTQLIEPADMDLCLFKMGKSKSLSLYCKRTIQELLATPLNQNSIDQLVFLFEQLEKNQINTKEYTKLQMSLSEVQISNTLVSEQLKTSMQKLKTKKGQENCELLVNGSSLMPAVQNKNKNLGLTRNAHYQFVLLCDTTKPFIHVGTIESFVDVLQQQAPLQDPFVSCRNKDVDFYLNEFSVLFSGDCVLNYPFRSTNFPLKSFSEIKSDGMDWKWIALLGAIVVGTQLKGKSYMVSF